MSKGKKAEEKMLSVDVEFNDMFDITVAEEFRLKLLDALSKAQTVSLLANKIERADTAALQMLCAFVKDAKTKGVSVKWSKPSKNLCSAVDLLGLSQVLELNSDVNL